MRPEDEFEADLGVDTVKQAELVARMRDRLHLDHDPEFRLSDYRTLRDLAVYAARRLNAMRTRPVTRPVRSVEVPTTAPVAISVPYTAAPVPSQIQPLPADAVAAVVEGALRAGLDGASADGVASAVAPALQSLVTALLSAVEQARPPAPVAAPAPAALAVPVAQPSLSAPVAQDVVVVATGASVGLPGGTELFDPTNIDAVLRGDNRIERIDERMHSYASRDASRNTETYRETKTHTNYPTSRLPRLGNESSASLFSAATLAGLGIWCLGRFVSTH